MRKETKNSISTVGFEFPTEGNWIYESPDGGQTIYRRRFGEHDSRERVEVVDDSDNFDINEIENKAPLIAEMMKGVENSKPLSEIIGGDIENRQPSEIDILRQKVVNLEMANADLKDMLRDLGATI